MYYDREKNRFKKPKNETLIDRWFNIRLEETYKIIYDSLLNYDLTKAAREIFGLVQDLSHWWLRRSRKRFQKPRNKQELIDALLKLEEYLFNISRLLAPFVPFFSEYLYQELKNEIRVRTKTEISIHLERYKEPRDLRKKDREILENMRLAKEISSQLLMLRKTNNIKIRQPLEDAYIGRKIDDEYLEIIKDEVNIRRVFIGEPKNKDEYLENKEKICVWLNKVITPELKEEGMINDFIRYIQDLRQDLGLVPRQKVDLYLTAGKKLKELINKNKRLIIKSTSLRVINFERPKEFDIEKEFSYGNFGKIIIYLKV